jgi:hypothetical protein
MISFFPLTNLGGFVPLYAILFVINLIFQLITGQFDPTGPTISSGS